MVDGGKQRVASSRLQEIQGAKKGLLDTKQAAETTCPGAEPA
jgi:hypothetical protein